jgi:hypothetical protein
MIGLAALWLACYSSETTGPETPRGPDPDQRYAVFRGIILSMLDECCHAAAGALAVREDVDTSVIRGLDWPIAIQSFAPTQVSGVDTNYYLSVDYRDNQARVIVQRHVLRVETALWDAINFRYSQPPDATTLEWVVSVHTGFWELDRDTVEARVSLSARQELDGLCNRRACQDYDLYFNTELSRESLDSGFAPLPGGWVSAVILETETSAYSDPSVQVRWELTGRFLMDHQVKLEVVSGPFLVHDTLSLCGSP